MADGCLPTYKKRQEVLVTAFLQILQEDNNTNHLVDLVLDPHNRKKKIPRVFALVSGEATLEKIEILNKCVVQFALSQCNSINDQLLQPNTVAFCVRTLLSGLRNYGVCISVSKHLKGF